jgi:hypothetical protein
MKHFGMEFKETEKGFTIEFSGDEETIQARKEAIAAWRDFVVKAKKAGCHGFPHPGMHHHGMHHHGGHKHGQCCNAEKKETETETE